MGGLEEVSESKIMGQKMIFWDKKASAGSEDMVEGRGGKRRKPDFLSLPISLR